MASPDRFQLHAYVCGNACLRRIDAMGSMSFTMIYIKRPDNCRYAVVSHWNIDKGADEVLVFDLFDVDVSSTDTSAVPPAPIFRGDDVDAAIMATFMTYKD